MKKYMRTLLIALVATTTVGFNLRAESPQDSSEKEKPAEPQAAEEKDKGFYSSVQTQSLSLRTDSSGKISGQLLIVDSDGKMTVTELGGGESYSEVMKQALGAMGNAEQRPELMEAIRDAIKSSEALEMEMMENKAAFREALLNAHGNGAAAHGSGSIQLHSFGPALVVGEGRKAEYKTLEDEVRELRKMLEEQQKLMEQMKQLLEQNLKPSPQIPFFDPESDSSLSLPHC